ncbi:MAG: hypothetical protein HY696_03695 [Deltaproteobacteria bacterium]|nr:hypothetical protein [Deltaproteobacteria bacterium]
MGDESRDTRVWGSFNLQCGYGFGLPVATSITEGGTLHRVECLFLDRKYKQTFGFGLGGAFIHGETQGKLLPVVGVDGTSTDNTTNGVLFSVVKMDRHRSDGKSIVSWWSADTYGVGIGGLTATTPGRRLNDGTTVPERSEDFTTLDFVDTQRGGLEIRLGKNFALAPFVGLSNGLHHAFMSDTEVEDWPYAVRDITLMVGADLVIGGDSFAPDKANTAGAEEIAYVLIGQYLLEIPKAYLNQRDLMEPIAQTAALNTMAKGPGDGPMAPYTEDLSVISVALPILSAMGANQKLAALHRFPEAWRPFPMALEGGRAILFGALGCFDDTPGKEGYCAEGLNSAGRVGSMLLIHFEAPKYALPIYRSALGAVLAVAGMLTKKPALVSSGFSTFTESAWDPVPHEDPDIDSDRLVASTTVTYAPYAHFDDGDRTAGRAVIRKRTQLGHGMVKAETAVAVAAPQLRVDSLLRRAGVGDEGLPDNDAPGTIRSEVGVGVDVPLGGGVNLHLGAGAHLLAKAQGTATHAGGGVQGDVALEIRLGKDSNLNLSLGCQVVKSWTDDHNELEIAPAIGFKFSR